MEYKDKIPVTVITGFLGSGKTTLLNRLIGEFPDKKFAIIENEFGEVGLDSELIINIDNGNICELANGCICCSLNDDLAGLLKDLLRSGKEFNHLLIETTGIADPSTVVQVFFSDQEIRTKYRMDSVICITDAIYFFTSLKDRPEIRQQVAVSDVILLNKADKATPAMIHEVKNTLENLNPNARIFETSYTQVENSGLLDTGSYEMEKIASFTMDITAREDRGGDKHNISPHSFVFPGDFDIEKFAFWIEYFLSINQANILRIKGVLSFADNPQKMILQSVRSSYELEGGDFWNVGEERHNRMVIIGSNLDYSDIREALESLMK